MSSCVPPQGKRQASAKTELKSKMEQPKYKHFAARKIQSLFRGAMARSRFKRTRLIKVTRQFDLLEEREIVMTRKKRVEAKEEFKVKLMAIKEHLTGTPRDEKSSELLLGIPKPPTLNRGHTDFSVAGMRKEWVKAENIQRESLTKEKIKEVQEQNAEQTNVVHPSPPSREIQNLKDLRPHFQVSLGKSNGDAKQGRKSEAERVDTLSLPGMVPTLVKSDSTPGKFLKNHDKVTLDFVTAMIDRFKKGEILDVQTANRLIFDAASIMKEEPNVQRIEVRNGSRCTVVGDLHGQLDDLIHIFSMNDLPSKRNMYIFNGDFVDRGKNSCEVIFVLFAFKILYPRAVFLNRGNHEAQDINEEMGFCRECTHKYERTLWNDASEAFKWLPLCAVINEVVFVVHGGLCWEDVTLQDIATMKRDHLIVPYETNMEDLLWSDPMDYDDDSGLAFKGRGKNEARNDAGCVFGEDVLDRFFLDNKVSLFVRSHECVDAGYEWLFSGKLVTVFSASKYRGKDDNLGSVMIFTPVNSKAEEKKAAVNGSSGVVAEGTENALEYKFIQYSATKMHRAKHFSLRLGSLENQVLTLMVRHISRARLRLIAHFDEISRSKEGMGIGYITRLQWKQGINKVLGVDIPFLAFQDMLGLPAYGIDGKYRGPIDYMQFLSRFAPLFRHLREEISERSTSSEISPRTEKKEAEEAKQVEEEDKKLNALLGQLMLAADRSGITNIETLFRYFDYDGDGKLGVQEFQVGLLSLAKVYPDLKFTPEEIEAVAKALGKNGVISYKNFFQNITVADQAYGRLLALDNKAEALEERLSKAPDLTLRKRISDELRRTQTKRDTMDIVPLMRRLSTNLGTMSPPQMTKARSLPAYTRT